jgi:hypothetical protein
MNITAIGVVGILTWGIYKLFELFVKRKERINIIEKIPFLMENKDLKGSIVLPEVLYKKQDSGSMALRLACLMLGIGLGCILGFFTQYYYFGGLAGYNLEDWHIRLQVEDMQSMIYFAFIAFFGGLGLFTAYLVELKRPQ